MSRERNGPMRPHTLALVAALGIGVVGFVVAFAVGSHTGSGSLGFLSAALTYLLGGFGVQRLKPASWWYGGAAINAPIWLVYLLLADRGQFQLNVLGLIVCLLAGYVGMFIATRLPLRPAP